MNTTAKKINGALLRLQAAMCAAERLLYAAGQTPRLDQETRRHADEMVDLVSSRLAVPRFRIMARDRSMNVALARQVTYCLQYDVLGLTMDQIGVYFHRDHGAVSHGIRAVADYSSTCQEFRRQLDDCISAARILANGSGATRRRK